MVEAFKEARLVSGLTQQNVADMLGMSLPTAGKFDSDPSRLTLGQLGVIIPNLSKRGKEIMSEYTYSFFA